MVDRELQQYIEEHILPRYDRHDAAHKRNHADTVIRQSLALAHNYDVDLNMVYTIAAYHDTGIIHGREHHPSHGAVHPNPPPRAWQRGGI